MIEVIINLLIIVFVLFYIAYSKLGFETSVFSISYLVYVHVSPTIVGLYEEGSNNYLIIQLLFFLFFFMPFFLFNKFGVKKRNVLEFKRNSSSNFKKQSLIITCLTVIPIYYIYITLKYGLIYKRIGLGLVDILSSMNFQERIVYKVFDWYSFFFIAALNYLYFVSRNKIVLFNLIIWCTIAFTSFLINSKLNLIVLVVMLLYTSNRLDYKKLLNLKYLALIGFVLLSLKATNELRYSFTLVNDQMTFDRSEFISRIFMINSENKGENENFFYRSNGVILASNLYEKVGILNFDFDFFEHIYLMSFLGDDNYKLISKSKGNTAGKIFLQQKYLNDDSPDNYSCLLTDVFGATGIFGLFILGLFFGWLFNFIRQLRIENNPRNRLFAIYLFSIFVFFESDILSNITKAVLFIIPTIVLARLIFPRVIQSKFSS
jgi:hypothetical protein